MAAAARHDNAALVARYRQGDAAAGEALLAANEPLVATIARKFAPRARSMELDDLMQEGRLGLLTAARKFDASRGHAFSTYAYPWVRQAITRAIQNQDRLIRLPTHLTERAAQDGDEGLPGCYVSLDEMVGTEEDARLGELLPAPGDTESEALARLDGAELAAALAALPERERRALLARADGATWREIAQEIGRTKLAAQQIAARGRARLAAMVGVSGTGR